MIRKTPKTGRKCWAVLFWLTYSLAYKWFVSAQLSLLTFSVYIGSSIYSAGIAGPNSVTEVFHITDTVALLGLTLLYCRYWAAGLPQYIVLIAAHALSVLGYGIGPMLWSPLCDLPQIGRLPICESEDRRHCN